VVDFIDMKRIENRKHIYERMKDEMEQDKAKHVILPLSKFGLMQITRERVRPEVNIKTLEVCPTCNGTGNISASIGIPDMIENNLDFIINKQNEKQLTLVVHPFLYTHFTSGFPSIRMKWYFRFMRWVKIEKDSSYALTEFRFVNKQGIDIDINTVQQ
jgi:ribonuclease G